MAGFGPWDSLPPLRRPLVFTAPQILRARRPHHLTPRDVASEQITDFCEVAKPIKDRSE